MRTCCKQNNLITLMCCAYERHPSLTLFDNPFDLGCCCLPELTVGMGIEGIDFHSVGNTLVLQQTALIEALNLKAAIDFQQKNCKNVTFCNMTREKTRDRWQIGSSEDCVMCVLMYQL